MAAIQKMDYANSVKKVKLHLTSAVFIFFAFFLLPANSFGKNKDSSASPSNDAAFSNDLNHFLKTLIPPSLHSKTIPLPQGLPDSLPSNILTQAGFEHFSPRPNTTPPLLVGSIQLNGRTIYDENNGPFDGSNVLQNRTEDDDWVYLPPQGKITRLNPQTKEESWIFPIGTRFADRIFFKTNPHQVFELRIIQRNADLTWSFGVYVPSRSSKTYTRLRKDYQTSFDSFIKDRPANFDITILGKDISPKNCLMCHSKVEGIEPPPQPNTGPCGFGPDEQKFLKPWVLEFKRVHGYSPFAN